MLYRHQETCACVDGHTLPVPGFPSLLPCQRELSSRHHPSTAVESGRGAQRCFSNVPDAAVYTGPVAPAALKRFTLRQLRAKYEAGTPLTMLTAYDYPSAVHVRLSLSNATASCHLEHLDAQGSTCMRWGAACMRPRGWGGGRNGLGGGGRRYSRDMRWTLAEISRWGSS